MSINVISCSDLFALSQNGQSPLLLDVRTGIEFAGVHAVGAVNMPLGSLDVSAIRTRANGKATYVICKSGKRAGKACEQLTAAGITDVINVEGGTDAWVAAGLPVQRRAVLSLERQVRIVVGLFVLAGVVLGWLVDPRAYWISGLMGAGLIFAGLTNTCALGMMLAKMPWNQGQATASACGAQKAA